MHRNAIAIPLLLITCCAGAAAEQVRRSTGDASSSAHATPWRPIGHTPGASVYIHAEKQRTIDGWIAVWRSQEFTHPEYLDKDTAYRSLRERVVVDCKAKRLGVTAKAYFSGTQASGYRVAHLEGNNPEWQSAVPDTPDAFLVTTVCAPPARIRKPSLRDQ